MALSQVPQEFMAQVPAGATAVDAIRAPDGGYWILGSDGGVFAVGGAPFLGAYTELDPIHRNDPNRRFSHIISSGVGGFSLVSRAGELYSFDVDRPPEVKAPLPPTVGTDVDDAAPQESAKVWLRGEMEKLGLGELGSWALERFTELGSTSGAADAVFIEMRERPEYQQKFPAMKLREKAGLAPITEKQYLDWRDMTKRMMQNAGLPESFYDQDEDFTDFIAKDVSPAEMKTRIEQGYQAALQAPSEVRDELQRLFNITPGQLAAFFLDPDRGQQEILNTVTRAQISGASQIQGFGRLSAEEAERLQSFGTGFEEAQRGFSQLVGGKELFGSISREEQAISREEQLSAAFEGEAGSQEKIQRRARKRAAAFEGGGGFAGGQEGLSGLGRSG